MSNDKIKGVTIAGWLKENGITVYSRNGKVMARMTSSHQPKRRTRKQFASENVLQEVVASYGDLPEGCF